MTKSIGKIVLKRMYDEDPDLSFLEQDYTDKDVTEEENKKYQERDRQRLEAFRNEEWNMIGIKAEAIIHIDNGRWKNSKGESAGWQIHKISSGGLWNIESDGSEEYFKEIEEQEIADLTDTLLEFGFSKSEIDNAPIEHKEE